MMRLICKIMGHDWIYHWRQVSPAFKPEQYRLCLRCNLREDTDTIPLKDIHKLRIVKND
jgi:hypothetical protein